MKRFFVAVKTSIGDLYTIEFYEAFYSIFPKRGQRNGNELDRDMLMAFVNANFNIFIMARDKVENYTFRPTMVDIRDAIIVPDLRIMMRSKVKTYNSCKAMYDDL